MATQPFYLQVENLTYTYLIPTALTQDTSQMIVEYDGFESTSASALTLQSYNMDGAVYQGSIYQPRQMTLYIYFTSKSYLTSKYTDIMTLFATGTTVRLTYGNQAGTYRRYIDAVVENVSSPRFTAPTKGKRVIQISLTAYDVPFWIDATASTASLSFNTSYSMNVFGDVATPMLIEVAAGTSISNPVFEVNSKTLTLTGALPNKIEIDTGARTIKYNNSPAISLWTHGSQWLYFIYGTNTISATVSNTPGRTITVTYYPRYLGINL